MFAPPAPAGYRALTHLASELTVPHPRTADSDRPGIHYRTLPLLPSLHGASSREKISRFTDLSGFAVHLPIYLTYLTLPFPQNSNSSLIPG